MTGNIFLLNRIYFFFLGKIKFEDYKTKKQVIFKKYLKIVRKTIQSAK